MLWFRWEGIRVWFIRLDHVLWTQWEVKRVVYFTGGITMFKKLVPGKKKRPVINTKCLEERNKCRFFNYGIYVSIFYVDHTCFPQFYHFFKKTLMWNNFFPWLSPLAYILALDGDPETRYFQGLFARGFYLKSTEAVFLHTSNDVIESPFENNDTVWCRPAKSNCPEYLKL